MKIIKRSVEFIRFQAADDVELQVRRMATEAMKPSLQMWPRDS